MAKITILLVDYEPRSIERFRQPLESAGYVVEIATDGLAGIEAFHRLSPDMVLVEAMIPKKHGFEVCQELKRTPHGRRTPVLITTGVYKGRKYRTQALHIYGCDEYIEKPIAAEQLLAVVGKFFNGGAGPGPGSPTDASSKSDAHSAGTPGLTDASGPSAPPTPAAVVPVGAAKSPGQARAMSRSLAVARDFTEEEIMARLDAILPSQESASVAPLDLEPAAQAAVATDLFDVPEPVEEPNPFLRMQAELTAELGSLSAALALEPAPVLDAEPEPAAIPSDQALPPSLLEALPLPMAEPAVLEPIPDAVAPAVEPQGQVVNFDAKRSKKKHKKHGRRDGEARHSDPAEPAAEPLATPRKSETLARPVTMALPEATAQELSIPPGTVLASELGASPQKRALPAWIWAIAFLGVGAGIYFGFFRGDASVSASPPDNPVRREAPAAPAPAAEVPVAEPAPAPSSPSQLATPATSAATVAPTAHPATHGAPATAAPSSKPLAQTNPPAGKPVVPSPREVVAPKDTSPPAAVPTIPAAAKPEEVESQPFGDAGSGVESIAAPPEAPAKPSVRMGALVPIGEVDSPPVTLSRRVPAYSMLAREMRAQGTVVLNVLVNERGTVDDVVIVTGVPGADLNDSAVKAAKQWTYQPATKGGVPVKVWKQESVSFKL